MYNEVFYLPDEYYMNLLNLFPYHTQIHCKCMSCTLHFKIYTWYPEKWKKRDPICPECGNIKAEKLRFEETNENFINFT